MDAIAEADGEDVDGEDERPMIPSVADTGYYLESKPLVITSHIHIKYAASLRNIS
jgi:hypothetical protein